MCQWRGPGRQESRRTYTETRIAKRTDRAHRDHADGTGLRVSTLKPSTPVAHSQASPSCHSTVLLDREMAMGATDLLLSRLEKELRPIARERIAKVQMPGEAPTRFWGGKHISRQMTLQLDQAAHT